jgi:magnesium transporter
MIEVVMAGSEPLWVDVIAPTPEDFETLAREYGLPANALQECTQARHLPRHQRLGEVTFIILRAYDEEAAVDADEYLKLTRKLAIFLGDRFLVTVHRRKLRFLEAMKAEARAAKTPIYLQAVLIDLLLAGVETFHEPLEEAEQRIHLFEAALLDRKSTAVASWRSIFQTKVRIQTIKRLLWHVQNSVQKFVPRAAVDEARVNELQERIASLSFFAESLDDDLDSLLGVQLSLSANRTNDVVRVLTIFSAFFLPLTFIVGVYGMNFEHMPELRHPYGYVGVWVVMIAVACGIALWFRRWLR